MPGTWTVLAITYFLGPTVAFAISRYGTTRMDRYRIAAIVLTVMLCIAYSVAAILDSPSSAVAVVQGTACPWAPQIAFLYLMHAVWKSGLRSAGVDLNAISDPNIATNHRLQRSGGGDRFDSG